MTLNSILSVFIADTEQRHTDRGREGSDTQKRRGVEGRGRNWNDPVARKAGSHQKLEVGKKSLLEPLREHGPGNTLILDLWPPELRENKIVFFFKS